MSGEEVTRAGADLRRDKYVLAEGDRAMRRLRLVDEVYGKPGRDLLDRVGLRPGMSVLDMGCGTGLACEWFSSRVGERGRVVGVDRSPAQLAVARATTSGLVNVQFVEASAYATGLPRASFDVVYARFLLMHLQRPVDALREMRALARPRGVVLCEEAAIDSSSCSPPSPAHGELQRLAVALGALGGADFNVARRLVDLFVEAGFSAPSATHHQPAYQSGACKALELDSFIEVAPRVRAAGLATDVEIEDVIAGVQRVCDDEASTYSLSRMMQVWAYA